jgi:hypothetical protein
LIRLWTAALTLGLSTGGVLAGKTHEEVTGAPYDNTKAPHETPYKAEPPTGGHKNLADAATNPIGNLIQVQIQDQYNWSNHNSDGYSNSAILQPVIPVSLPWAAVPTMVTRTTLPYVTTPDLGGPVGRKNGLGDLSIIAPLIPKLKAKGIMIGLGPALSAPTATDDFTGSGKWSAGPTAVYFNGRTKGWQWGILGWHLWDFAGDDDRDSVNKTFFQPFVVKHFDKGWYAGTPDVPGTYNWRNGQTTFPLGLRVGRVTKIGKQPVNLMGEVFNSPWDDGASSEWSVKLSFTLLFPK